MTITTIFVPLDGSERAELALGPASVLAARANAELVLVSAPWPATSPATVERYLDVRAAFTEHPTSYRLAPDDSPARAITALAEDPAALVCMTTRGRGAVSTALLGSVATEVVRSSHHPVMIVGPRCDPKWHLRGDPCVVAGLDGSRFARTAACNAGVLARSLHGRVLVCESVRPSDVITVREHLGEDRRMLADVVAELRSLDVRADYEIVDAFDPVDALIGAARAHAPSCLAVASRGRRGVDLALLGTVAGATIRRAPCPVLVSGPADVVHAVQTSIDDAATT